ncbi:hypothetical protein AAG570_010246, partial [Ranatra chinensis]
PDKWPNKYQTCSGKYQSPVNIDESLVTKIIWPPLTFSGTRALPLFSTMTNNGHTVKLEFNTTEPILMTGGPLLGLYKFKQLHFHWGKNDSVGSENQINSQSFSMELHIVFYKVDYGNVYDAMNYDDGLAVLALFFEASDKDNRVYSELIDSLKKVVKPDSHTKLPYQLPLEFMLPEDRVHYYTYRGSLTTPPCYEIVTWIDFVKPVYISHKQLAQFRHIRSPQGRLTHNLRPIQPLYGRPVYYNLGTIL